MHHPSSFFATKPYLKDEYWVVLKAMILTDSEQADGRVDDVQFVASDSANHYGAIWLAHILRRLPNAYTFAGDLSVQTICIVFRVPSFASYAIV